MTKKPIISKGDKGIVENGHSRPLVTTKRLLAAYAEMATDQDREADAEQWLGAFAVGQQVTGTTSDRFFQLDNSISR